MTSEPHIDSVVTSKLRTDVKELNAKTNGTALSVSKPKHISDSAWEVINDVLHIFTIHIYIFLSHRVGEYYLRVLRVLGLENF